MKDQCQSNIEKKIVDFEKCKSRFIFCLGPTGPAGGPPGATGPTGPTFPYSNFI